MPILTIFGIGSTLLAQRFAPTPPYQGPGVSPSVQNSGFGSYFGGVSINKGYEDDGAYALPNPLGITDLSSIVDKIMSALTVLAVPVVLAMVMYGAFKIITSGGDPSKAKEGGNIILYAAVGFGLLLISNGIVAIVQSLFQ